MRPPSIVRFEQLYLAAIIVGLVNTALAAGWLGDLAPADPSVLAIGGAWLAGGVALSVAVSLLLWYLIARRASNVARWVLVVLVVFGVLAGVYSALSGRYPTGLAGMLGAVNSALQVLGIWCLFRPDAAGWFASGTTRADLGETFE